jgi:hypothetical protein
MFNVDDKAGSPLALSDDILPPLHPHPEKKRKLRKKIEDGAASYATRREEITDFSDTAFNTLGNHAQSSRCNLSPRFVLFCCSLYVRPHSYLQNTEACSTGSYNMAVLCQRFSKKP